MNMLAAIVAIGFSRHLKSCCAHAVRLRELAELIVAARAVGQLCGVSGTADIVDASVALAGRQRRLRVVTSDPDDISRLDRRLELVPI